MTVCVAVYQRSRGRDLAAFTDDREARAWRTEIAKNWWAHQFPTDEPPNEETIGEEYFKRMAESSTPEYFEFVVVDLEPRTSQAPLATADLAPLSVPTVHLNGTSRESLLEQMTDASHALSAALQALQSASPHGRDYYPQGKEAIRKASREHASRYERVRSVQREIDQIAEALPAGR